MKNCPTCGQKIKKESEYKPDAIRCIDYLNRKTGHKYKMVDSNLRNLIARLKEGHSLDDVKSVIDFKCKEWTGTQWDYCLRPKTLFNATNFNSYVGQAGKLVAHGAPVEDKYVRPDDPEPELKRADDAIAFEQLSAMRKTLN